MMRLSILDTTDVIALAEEKAEDLTDEAWTEQAEGYLTEVAWTPDFVSNSAAIFSNATCISAFEFKRVILVPSKAES